MAYEPAEPHDESVPQHVGTLFSADSLSFLADHATSLDDKGRARVRDSLHESQLTEYLGFLAVYDEREDREGGRLRERAADEAHQRLVANLDAKRRQQELEAAERGHVSSRIKSYAELKAMARPTPLIPNVLYSGAVGIMLGDSQVGKTWVLLSIAAAAAHGAHWPVAPADPTIKPPAQLKVLYVAAEDGGSIGARLECWERAHDRDLTTVTFDSHPYAINLLDDVQIDELCEAVMGNGYRLVIFDTIAASLGGEEEGNPQFSKAVQNMRKVIAAMNGEGSVLLAHHFGKDKTKGARGGSSLFNDSDIVWELDGSLDLMQMTCKKWKADSVRRPWHLHLNRAVKDAVHIAATQAPSSGSLSALTDKLSIMEDYIFKAVTEFGSENQGYGPSGSSIGGYLTKSKIPYREKDFREMLSLMVSDGRLMARKGPRNSQFYRFPPVQEGLDLS